MIKCNTTFQSFDIKAAYPILKVLLNTLLLCYDCFIDYDLLITKLFFLQFHKYFSRICEEFQEFRGP